MAIDSGLATIIVAVISGGFGIWAIRVSKENQKSTKVIKEVLDNSPVGTSSLDQVIKIMQDELKASSLRHEKEIRYQGAQIEDLQANLKHCQHERSSLSVRIEELEKRIRTS